MISILCHKNLNTLNVCLYVRWAIKFKQNSQNRAHIEANTSLWMLVSAAIRIMSMVHWTKCGNGIKCTDAPLYCSIINNLCAHFSCFQLLISYYNAWKHWKIYLFGMQTWNKRVKVEGACHFRLIKILFRVIINLEPLCFFFVFFTSIDSWLTLSFT